MAKLGNQLGVGKWAGFASDSDEIEDAKAKPFIPHSMTMYTSAADVRH